MKIKKHFFFTVSGRKFSRTYGGSDYTVSVFENQGRGRFKHLGERTACTRAHKGEVSEAWSVIWDSKALGKIKRSIEQHPTYTNGHFSAYYTHRMEELFGVKLENMGGA